MTSAKSPRKEMFSTATSCAFAETRPASEIYLDWIDDVALCGDGDGGAMAQSSRFCSRHCHPRFREVQAEPLEAT